MLPEPRTLWKHKESGASYRVLVVANTTSELLDPVVVFERCEDQTVWARTLTDWEERYVRA